MASTKVCAAFRVLVLSEIRIIPMSVRHFFNFVPLFAEDNKLLFAPFWSSFRFVEPSKRLAKIRYPARGQTLKSFGRHYIMPPFAAFFLAIFAAGFL